MQRYFHNTKLRIREGNKWSVENHMCMPQKC